MHGPERVDERDGPERARLGRGVRVEAVDQPDAVALLHADNLAALVVLVVARVPMRPVRATSPNPSAASSPASHTLVLSSTRGLGPLLVEGHTSTRRTSSRRAS